jgi:hypothetical protein
MKKFPLITINGETKSVTGWAIYCKKNTSSFCKWYRLYGHDYLVEKIKYYLDRKPNTQKDLRKFNDSFYDHFEEVEPFEIQLHGQWLERYIEVFKRKASV